MRTGVRMVMLPRSIEVTAVIAITVQERIRRRRTKMALGTVPSTRFLRRQALHQTKATLGLVNIAIQPVNREVVNPSV